MKTYRVIVAVMVIGFLFWYATKLSFLELGILFVTPALVMAVLKRMRAAEAIRFTCPHCDNQLTAKKEETAVMCSKCQNPVTVPGADHSEQPEEARVQS